MNIEDFSNGDGTYNGVRMLAALTGLDEREVAWTAARIKQLIKIEGIKKDEAKRIVSIESKDKPWLQ